MLELFDFSTVGLETTVLRDLPAGSPVFFDALTEYTEGIIESISSSTPCGVSSFLDFDLLIHYPLALTCLVFHSATGFKYR